MTKPLKHLTPAIQHKVYLEGGTKRRTYRNEEEKKSHRDSVWTACAGPEHLTPYLTPEDPPLSHPDQSDSST